MFLEPLKPMAPKRGWIEIVCGSMFSGKTEELMRRLKRAEYANQKYILFKPKIDNRYHESEVVSHDQKSIKAIPLDNASEIIDLVKDEDIVGIDEAQFFGKNLVDICNHLANNGKRIIVAGLDMDFLGKSFGPIPYLLSTAEFVTKLHAICSDCGNIAGFSYRLGQEDEQILLGEKQEYLPLCRVCYINRHKNKSD